MISPRTSPIYRQIRYWVDLIEGSHNAICAKGLRNLREFGDYDLIEEFKELIVERKANQGALQTVEGYIHDVFILGKIATLAGMVDVALECANMVKNFRDNPLVLAKVLKDIKLSQLHQALCENAYNN